ncbi:MAG: hypothetical protein JXR14_08675 [Paracoccaceae bacterium]
MDLANVPVPAGDMFPNAEGDSATPAPDGLTRSQKAAIILRMIQSDGGRLALPALSERAQTRLARDFLTLGHVENSVLELVLQDLETELAREGLSFPDTIADTLEALDTHLSPDLLTRMRQRFGISSTQNPWPSLDRADPKELRAALEKEHPKITAVVLSQLAPDSAAELLKDLPDAAGTEATYAISLISNTSEDVIRLIGTALQAEHGPVEDSTDTVATPALIAGILNPTGARRRDEIIAALGAQDAELAAQVRSEIFTFGDIAERLSPADIPTIVRAIPEDTLIAGLVAAQAGMGEVVEFIFANMSQRMATQLRDEMAERDTPSEEEGEAAMSELTNTISKLRDLGEISYS